MIDTEADAWSVDQHENSPKELDIRKAELFENVGGRTATVTAPPDHELDHVLLESICGDGR
ncbi:hypothetical protein HZU40_33765 (plasmid) [Mycolicibacterium fluoranthenivorans]|uniref:Uncharacterized protein n=1 Tax=Mycolicibacterium fluoranthenivorans TaxID=258505 RepID=A0A7G8PQ88_9MYCO|nr:hypothetical protein [Mycolicibacterium fluoranthenivorans]QNJ96504.1 hypothetical protein HZU40_33765 [Mycolicibacterium fluoranthenivorans]